MKLIIDIDEGDYKWIKDHVMTVNEQRIANGILLDDVLNKIKAEISEYKDDKIIHAERNEMINIVLGIIDKYRG